MCCKKISINLARITHFIGDLSQYFRGHIIYIQFLFIYLCLHCVLLWLSGAVCGFPLFGKQGLSCSLYMGFSFWWLLFLQILWLWVVFACCVNMVWYMCCPAACGILPDQGRTTCALQCDSSAHGCHRESPFITKCDIRKVKTHQVPVS